ncbi:mitochondrial ribosomal subunit protein-domain-containing protein [Mycena alexandri]|uniref:Mitochondrial ribosomal subunit protein-domain-containing protein n=1 Tax=Mycena alexandri TaxID=1745969 RepID=A0AAD6T6L4_9AGAR|nr:mitochondrial ribosomal subunit protein-domain-containing protein [Mycena alexandri]
MSLCFVRRIPTAPTRTALHRSLLSFSRGLATEAPTRGQSSAAERKSGPSATADASAGGGGSGEPISLGIGTSKDDFEYYEDLLEAEYADDDTPALGHLILREQRQALYYLRLIEHEMPKLVAYRKPFVPPTDAPLVVRSINYAGEEHPATVKRAIVVAVDDLPLKDKDAIHRIKVLAGPRWTPNPPTDGGISGLDEWKNGYIKIACDDFPKPAMNLKWASDTMDRLVAHANNPNHDLKDVPVDLRHVYAKARKAKKGEHTRSRVLARPSILDFPLEWIPERRRKYALSA